MRTLTLLAATTVALAALAGCSNPFKEPEAEHYRELGFTGADVSGKDPTKWPDLHGAKVRILDQGAFAYTFGDAKAGFERLTNGTVELVGATDAGSALRTVLDAKGKPPADVIYGLDNAYLGLAVDAGVLVPYKPVLAPRIDEDHIFFGGRGTPESEWWATPVDHGYVAVNYDPREVTNMANFEDLRKQAGRFVTEDPNLSTPGLGFLLITVAQFNEDNVNSPYDWHEYWRQLWRSGVTVEDTWTTAYTNRFTAGYGSKDAGGEGLSDKPIVVSYTTSPAYEVAIGGRDPQDAAKLLLAPGATWKSVETMAILKGTPNLLAAEAWVEYTLTDQFQALMASHNAVYPVVDWEDPAVDPANTYQGLDPPPASLAYSELDWREVGGNLERWLCEWDALRDNDDLTICLQGA